MTGLTDREVRHLLAVTMSYDNRKPSDAAVLSWSEAAARGRWTFDEAVEAINEHYVRSTEFLMPAHITALIRARRQDQAMRKPIAAPNPVGQARVTRMLAGAFSEVDDQPIPLWKTTLTETKRETKTRRERVLRYPDLATKLTQPPLNLANPTLWNGYIPPRTLPGTDENPYDKANDSPIRQQLVAIAAEALQRENGDATP